MKEPPTLAGSMGHAATPAEGDGVGGGSEKTGDVRLRNDVTYKFIIQGKPCPKGKPACPFSHEWPKAAPAEPMAKAQPKPNVAPADTGAKAAPNNEARKGRGDAPAGSQVSTPRSGRASNASRSTNCQNDVGLPRLQPQPARGEERDSSFRASARQTYP